MMNLCSFCSVAVTGVRSQNGIAVAAESSPFFGRFNIESLTRAGLELESVQDGSKDWSDVQVPYDKIGEVLGIIMSDLSNAYFHDSINLESEGGDDSHSEDAPPSRQAADAAVVIRAALSCYNSITRDIF